MDPSLEWYSFTLIYEPIANEPRSVNGHANPQSESREKRRCIVSAIVKAGSLFGSLLMKQAGSGESNLHVAEKEGARR